MGNVWDKGAESDPNYGRQEREYIQSKVANARGPVAAFAYQLGVLVFVVTLRLQFECYGSPEQWEMVARAIWEAHRTME